MKYLKIITTLTIGSCILFGCVKNEEYNGKANILLAKPSLDLQLNSTYFSIGTIPNANENQDTTLVTASVLLTGIPPAKQDINVQVEIDSIFVKDLISKANDTSVPDANKTTQVLAYKGASLLPADCFNAGSLNVIIPSDKRSASVNVIFHKTKLAQLSGKIKYVLPFRVVTASQAINPDRDLCVFSLKLVKPKPIITSVAYENVALNKTVTVSDINSPLEGGTLAVDGNKLSDASRWVSSSSTAHFLEINLGSPTQVNGFATWYGTGFYNSPQAQFNFQVWVNNQWITVESETANTDPQYVSIITPIVTTKIRYNVPAYTNNTVRMYEIEVYRKK